MKDEEKKGFNSWFYILVTGFILLIIGIFLKIWILIYFALPVSSIVCGIYHFFNDIYSKGWLSKTWRIIYGCGYIGLVFFLLLKTLFSKRTLCGLSVNSHSKKRDGVSHPEYELELVCL